MSVLNKDSDLTFPHVLIIDASAGSGKTETLAQRFIQFLLSHRIKHSNLSNILAITFTNNAAREMKERILKWLKTCALKISSRERQTICDLVALSPEDLAREADQAVEDIINHYSDFHIQTIDSFMSRILHASAVELGLPLHSEITESYKQLIDLTLSIMLRDLNKIIPEEQLERFLDLMEHEAGTSFVWDPAWKLERRFEEFLQAEGKELLDIAFDGDAKLFEEQLKKVRNCYDAVKKGGFETYMRTPARDALTTPLFSIKRFLTGFSNETLWFKKRSVTEDMLSVCGELLETVRDMSEAYSRSHYMHYAPLYRQFKERLQQVKRRSETMHFDDINKRLAQYIRSENIPEIYYRLGDILYHFLLDEFQDTDIVQWKNMQLLLDEAFAKGGSLFAVGDLKQAIYMFRKADYRIMHRIVEGIRTRREYEDYYLPYSVINNARVTRLTENYRSAPVILSYVNMIFKNRLKQLTGTTLLKEDVTGLTSFEQNVKTNRDVNKKSQEMQDGYVRVVVTEKSGTETEKTTLYHIIDDVTKRFRYRDVAILARKNTEVEQVVGWLNDRGIPAASFSSLDIRKRKVIMEIIALVRFLDAPVDSLSFSTFLMGDVFQRNLQTSGMLIDLSDIRQKLFTQCKKTSRNLYVWFRDQHALKDVWDIYFDDLFNKVGYMPLYDLVSQIYRTFKVFSLFPEETGFLVKFLETIGVLETRGLNNIKDFLEMVTRESGESIMEIVLPDYIDAVKVMTFHKAKGLGFAVVINLLYESRRRMDPMYIKEEGDQLQPYYITKEFLGVSPKLAGIYQYAQQEYNIQDLNMLYVANTRAKRELYNIIIRKPGKSNSQAKHRSLMDLFSDFEDGAKSQPGHARRIVQPLKIATPEKVYMRMPREDEGSWFVERLVEIRKGDMYHRILAQIKTRKDADNLADFVRAACVHERGAYDEQQMRTVIHRFLHEPAIMPFFEDRPGRVVLQETEFVDREGSLCRPDRVVIDNDQVAVIDFKSGAPLAQHKDQVRRYMKVIRELYKDRSVQGHIAYVDSCEVQGVQ